MMLFFIFFFVYEVWFNWYLIERERKSPIHWQRSVFRLLVFSAIPLMMAFEPWYLAALSFQLMFWFCFDVALNIARGKAWNYQGKTSFIDRITFTHSNFFWVLKFLLAVVGLDLYFSII